MERYMIGKYTEGKPESSLSHSHTHTTLKKESPIKLTNPLITLLPLSKSQIKHNF